MKVYYLGPVTVVLVMFALSLYSQRYRKQSKPIPKPVRILFVVLGVLLIASGILVITSALIHGRTSVPATITEYEDANGWVYQCSQPIAAKTGTATTLGHEQGPVPKNLSEANQYCHKIGIE